MLLNYNPRHCLPCAEDLPDSDDTPVDNQLQHFIPGLLEAILALIWAERMDWFFGVDMGIYYDPKEPAIVPDGFLSIGVPRIIDSDLRLSYVLWEEQKLPILVLEVVSQTKRGEYSRKKEFYAEMGILYYLIYNPLRKRKPALEVYQLQNGEYELLKGEPIWLTEIGLGIGREFGTYLGVTREWLYWYDESGKRYLTPEERIVQERQQGEQQGRKEGKQELILQLIGHKFQQIPRSVEQEIKQLSSSQLDNLALAVLGFSQLEELKQWLEMREISLDD
jgi:Uma2 family endonuclease